EQVESIIVAVMEKSLEFVIRYLECSVGSENKRNLDEELSATKKKNTVKRVADEEYTERRIASKDC
ncbi:hypothetical protein Tco_0693660, partial [Tanacetum coccineum]